MTRPRFTPRDGEVPPFSDGRALPFLCLLAAMSVGLTLVAFHESLGYWFTDIDTLAQLHESRVSTGGEVMELLVKPLTGGRAGIYANFYRPVSNLVFGGLHRLFGWEPFGYHAFQLLLQSLNGLLLGTLVFVLAHRGGMPRAGRTAFVAAAIFLVHPLAEEIVPATARIGDLVVTSCFLVSLLLVDRLAGRLSLGRPVPLLTVTAAMAVTLGAKESGVLLVVAAPLYLLLVRRDLPFRPRGREAALLLVAGSLLTFCFLLARIPILGSMLGGYHELTLPMRLGFISRVALSLPVDLLAPGIVPELEGLLPEGTGQLLLRSALLPSLFAVTGLLLLHVWRKHCTAGAAAVAWCLAMTASTGLLFAATATYERRYGYGALPFVALMLAIGLTGPMVSGGRRWAARLVSGAVVMLLLAQSPMLRSYREWKSCGEVCHLMTAGSYDSWSRIPDGARVYLLNLPVTLSIDRLRRDPISLQGRSSTRVLSHYSLEAWLESHFPEKKLQLVQLGSFVYIHPPRLFRLDARLEDGRLQFRKPETTFELDPLGARTAVAYRGDARNGDESGFRVVELPGGRRELTHPGRPLPDNAYVVVFDGEKPLFVSVRELATTEGGFSGDTAALPRGADPVVTKKRAAR